MRGKRIGLGMGVMVGFGAGVFGVVGESRFRSFCTTTEGLEIALSDVARSMEEAAVNAGLKPIEIDGLAKGRLRTGVSRELHDSRTFFWKGAHGGILGLDVLVMSKVIRILFGESFSKYFDCT